MKQDEQFFLVESDKLEQNLHALVRQQNLDMEESTRSLLTLAMVSALLSRQGGEVLPDGVQN